MGYMVTGKHQNEYSNLIGMSFSTIMVDYYHMDKIFRTIGERVFFVVADKAPSTVVEKAPHIVAGKATIVGDRKAPVVGFGIVLVTT